MTVYVSEVPTSAGADHDEDKLHIVRNGVEVRLPLNTRDNTVVISEETPEWVPELVSDRGYNPVDQNSTDQTASD